MVSSARLFAYIILAIATGLSILQPIRLSVQLTVTVTYRCVLHLKQGCDKFKIARAFQLSALVQRASVYIRSTNQSVCCCFPGQLILTYHAASSVSIFQISSIQSTKLEKCENSLRTSQRWKFSCVENLRKVMIFWGFRYWMNFLRVLHDGTTGCW